ncbi:MAG: CDP-glycerol glycerophosphotransferase family protein [Bacteroidales bacterium]
MKPLQLPEVNSMPSSKHEYFNARKQARLNILKLINFIGSIVFFILETLIPKNKRVLLVLESEPLFMDNGKHFFLYARQRSEMQTYFFVKSKTLFVELNKQYPHEIVYAKSLQALLLFLKSRHVIMAYAVARNAFFPYYLLRSKKNIIYMGHGIKLKRLSHQVARYRVNNNRVLLQKYSYTTACSDIERIVDAACFDIWMENVWITGYPRNDFLLCEDTHKNLDEKFSYLKKRILLYAPTWRELNHSTEFFPFADYDPKELNLFLREKDVYLLIRAHKQELLKSNSGYGSDLYDCDRIVYAGNDIFPDVSELLVYTDILITDYSSIYIDFLLLDRPVMFFCHDLEQYKATNGLLFDYNSVTPGDKVFSQREFLESINTYLENPSIHSDKRQMITEQFHNFYDCDASKRIYENILDL